jgi:hypothetical protein
MEINRFQTLPLDVSGMTKEKIPYLDKIYIGKSELGMFE